MIMKKAGQRHIIHAVLAVLLAAALIHAVPVLAAPSLSRTALVLAVGKKYDLDVAGTRKAVVWTSSDPETASVSAAGKITACAAGKASIYAKTGALTLKCSVTVRKPVRSDEMLGKRAGKWKKQNGAKYYLLEDGSMAVGARRIGDIYYVFDPNGALLQPENTSIVRAGKNRYYVTPEGKAVSGWHIIKKKLYKTSRRGRILTDRTVDGIALTKNGSAADSVQAVWKKKFIQTAKAVTNERMTRGEKLRACWNYVASHRNFRYALKYPTLSETDWQKKTAYNMLTTRSGNCYSFACAFAALANEVGYRSYVVCGRVSGSRDHARDGLTRHAWVRIGGLNYDPEGQFAGWYRGCYGASGYRIRHTVQKTVRFW